jgi:hypothetical protein
VRSNSNQYHTPQLTFAAFIASCAAIFGLKVERSGEVFEVSANILHRAMAEMILMHCVDVVKGEVFDVDESGLN